MSITKNIRNLSSGDLGQTLASASQLGTAVGNIGNRISSIVSQRTTPSHIRDLYTNGFLAKDSVFIPKFFARAFDEPTYLTFRIEFIWNDDRNIAYNNSGLLSSSTASAKYSNMFDFIPEPFLEGYPLDDDMARFSNNENKYSAESYLDINLGDHGRASLLHNFRAALRDIEINFPYYFKSISGLSSLTSVDSKNGARLKNAALTLDCEEGIDLKITQLINAYRKIVWDDIYQRWILPDMMRYFGMRIYISEIRLFHQMRTESAYGGVDINIFGNQDSKNPKTYDFSDNTTRNATTLPLGKAAWWEIANKAVTTGTAVSSAFLGTASTITKVSNIIGAARDTTMSVLSGINTALNDLSLCNSALNKVMPTLCFECHMCEFDVSNSLEYLNDMYSDVHNSKKVSPKLKIKIGQVRESQAYPLNKTLRMNDNGSEYLNELKDYATGNIELNNAKDISDYRNDVQKYGYLGQYIYDNALIGKYTRTKLGERMGNYQYNLRSSVDSQSGMPLSQRRLTDKVINAMDINNGDKQNKFDYSKEVSPDTLAAVSLAAGATNEIVELGRENGRNPEIWGVYSTATNPDQQIKEGMTEIANTFAEAENKIYNGLNSMAINPEIRNRIANELFKDFLENVSTATESQVLKQMIQSYAAIKGMNLEDLPNSQATETENIDFGNKSYEDVPLSEATNKRPIAFGGITPDNPDFSMATNVGPKKWSSING